MSATRLTSNPRVPSARARVGASLQGGGLLRDAYILGHPVVDHAAGAGEPEHDFTVDLAAERRPPAGVVAEEDHGR